MIHKRIVARIVPVFLLGAVGCGFEDGAAYFDANLVQVNRIRSNAALTGQQKREQLTDLGFDNVTINAILRDTRTANQDGGDLRTAYNKVTGSTFRQLTPDEIQIYGDATGSATFTDSQATGVAKIFKDFSVDSADDLEAVLDDEQLQFPSSVNADDVRAVFVDFDPDDLIDDLPS